MDDEVENFDQLSLFDDEDMVNEVIAAAFSTLPEIRWYDVYLDGTGTRTPASKVWKIVRDRVKFQDGILPTDFMQDGKLNDEAFVSHYKEKLYEELIRIRQAVVSQDEQSEKILDPYGKDFCTKLQNIIQEGGLWSELPGTAAELQFWRKKDDKRSKGISSSNDDSKDYVLVGTEVLKRHINNVRSKEQREKKNQDRKKPSHKRTSSDERSTGAKRNKCHQVRGSKDQASPQSLQVVLYVAQVLCRHDPQIGAINPEFVQVVEKLDELDLSDLLLEVEKLFVTDLETFWPKPRVVKVNRADCGLRPAS
jgi:hypothetical protein